MFMQKGESGNKPNNRWVPTAGHITNLKRRSLTQLENQTGHEKSPTVTPILAILRSLINTTNNRIQPRHPQLSLVAALFLISQIFIHVPYDFHPTLDLGFHGLNDLQHDLDTFLNGLQHISRAPTPHTELDSYKEGQT